MKPYSLTKRLIVIVLLIELVSELCVTAAAFVYEEHMHLRAFDVLLRGRADSILGAVQDSEDAADNVMMDGSEISIPPDDLFEVRETSGRVVGQSLNWPDALQLNTGAQKERWRSRPEPHGTGQQAFTQFSVAGTSYRMIRIEGLRIVDPGDANGGIRRYVWVYYGSPVRQVWLAIFRSVGFYAISSLLVLAFTGTLMLWLLNRGLSPLRELASSAGKVSVSSWSFSPPERARMIHELMPLVTAIESAVAGLERSFEQQRRFTGDAAHELKTGVAVVKSSLQLLNMKQRTAAEYKAGLERCLVDCVRMEEIVGQMLALARLEEGSADQSSEAATEIHSTLKQVASQLETIARIRNIAILIHGPLDAGGEPVDEPVDEPVIVQIDPAQFKLLCSNVLINAIQHSPADSVIGIEIRNRSGCAEIEIHDEGDGIDAADLPHVFERFFRNDPSRSRNTGGTGLGLAICKAIADRFNGTIAIDSERSVGTSVTISFPVIVPSVTPVRK
jgi:signal transduction histidine kinase